MDLFATMMNMRQIPGNELSSEVTLPFLSVEFLKAENATESGDSQDRNFSCTKWF